MDTHIKFIPPFSYFVGEDIIGITYYVKDDLDLSGKLVIENYEILNGDDGSLFFGFKKRGKEKVYFLCPFNFLKRVSNLLKDGTTSIQLQLVFVKPIKDLDDETIGYSCNVKISTVEILKLAMNFAS